MYTYIAGPCDYRLPGWYSCLQTPGGEGGIRTHGTLMRYTRSPGVPIQPALAPLRAVLSARPPLSSQPLPRTLLGERWRRERDLNPRGTFWAPNRFRVDRLRPLGHPSSPARTTITQLAGERSAVSRVRLEVSLSTPPTKSLWGLAKHLHPLRWEGTRWRAQEELNLRPLPPQGSALSI
jgi:hypothetical protein